MYLYIHRQHALPSLPCLCTVCERVLLSMCAAVGQLLAPYALPSRDQPRQKSGENSGSGVSTTRIVLFRKSFFRASTI